MSGLFKGKTKEVTDKSAQDPYANMPDWLRDSFQNDVEFRNNFLKSVQAEAEAKGSNPREVLGISEGEWGALNSAGAATDAASQGQQEALDKIRGASDNLVDWKGTAGPAGDLGAVDKAGDWQTVQGPDGTFKPTDGSQLVDYDAMRGKYENQYTGAVVDTTLAGMTRDEQRAQLARDAKNAAVGGTSNSRSAVADAVAGNLSGMSKAQMEAKLRSDAFNTAAGFGLQEGEQTQKFYDSDANFRAGQASEEREYGLDLANFGLDQEQKRMAAALQAQGMSLQEAVARATQGNTAADFAAEQAAREREYGLDRAGLDMSMGGAMSDMTQAEYLRRFGLAGLQGDMAGADRGLRQGQIDSNYGAKQDALTWMGDMFTGSQNKGTTPVGYEETATSQKETPSTFSKILGGAAQVAGIYAGISDERVKEDIAPADSALDKIDRLSAYTYRYKDGFGHTKARTTGLMAQDVERAGIVGGTFETADGVKGVDFYPVLSTIVQAVKELRDERRPGAGL